MNIRWIPLALFTSLVMMISAVSAHAITSRAFVSSTGNDANAATNCAQSAPCRTFAGAIGVVSAGGELIALDSSGYGPVTINQAITIAAAPGQTAFIIVAGGTTGITVNPGAGLLVTLRNLNLNGQGTANSTGISQTSGNLILENTRLQQLATGFRGTAGNALATDCSFISNATRGVHLSGTSKMDLVNCFIAYNGKGVTVDGVGGCPWPFGSTAPTTVARLDGGTVLGNTTYAFEMLNVGVATCGGAHGQNIFVRIKANQQDLQTNIPGVFGASTNYIFVQGVASANQVFIGVYSAPTNGTQP